MSTIQMKKARRSEAFIKMSVRGGTGCGKTYSALLLAKGLVGDWEKVCLIDTENGSGSLYEHLGAYWTIQLDKFSPSSYIEAIRSCVSQGIEAIVIDSTSHEWEYILDYQQQLGGRFQDWAAAKKIHAQFVNELLQCKAHIICTNRVKQDYAVETNDKGKAVVTKLGMANKQQEGLDYEFTIVFDINPQHLAHADKDRTMLFTDREDFKITEETGELVRNWCKGTSVSKEVEIDIQDSLSLVNNATDIKELVSIWNDMSQILKSNEKIKTEFTKKKNELTIN